VLNGEFSWDPANANSLVVSAVVNAAISMALQAGDADSHQT
jgi:hypothetical protein